MISDNNSRFCPDKVEQEKNFLDENCDSDDDSSDSSDDNDDGDVFDKNTKKLYEGSRMTVREFAVCVFAMKARHDLSDGSA